MVRRASSEQGFAVTGLQTSSMYLSDINIYIDEVAGNWVQRGNFPKPQFVVGAYYSVIGYEIIKSDNQPPLCLGEFSVHRGQIMGFLALIFTYVPPTGKV